MHLHSHINIFDIVVMFTSDRNENGFDLKLQVNTNDKGVIKDSA